MIPNYLVEFLCIVSVNPIEDEFIFHLRPVIAIANTHKQSDAVLMDFWETNKEVDVQDKQFWSNCINSQMHLYPLSVKCI